MNRVRLQHQRGSVLIIALLLSLMLTTFGLSAAATAILEQRLAGNYHDYRITFETAEAALAEAEYFVLTTALSPQPETAPCTGPRCFTASCQQGLCNSVDYRSIEECSPRAEQPWQTSTVWESATNHRRAALVDDVAATARYIIEFRCFLTTEPLAAQTPMGQRTDTELYRITVLATGNTTATRVALQTLLQKPVAPAPDASDVSEPLATLETAEARALRLFQQRTALRLDWRQLVIY